MKKYIFIITLSLFFTLSAYAGEAKSDNWVQSTQHSPHPPHDHHDPDHMKYIRREEKSNKKVKK